MIDVDTGERVRVDERRLLELPLRAGDALAAGAVERLRAWQRVDLAERRMLRLLAVRARSQAEVERRLGRLDLEPAEVGEITGRLIGAGLIDDLATASTAVRRELRRGTGVGLIRARLEQLDVDPQAAAQALDVAAAGDERERAARVVRTRLGQPPWSRRDRARAAAHLLRRGYDADTVEAVLGIDE
ncbi:MAG TPA: RecX family transcriptional regulator [Gaiellales bacterium]|nr:RecX family transcriptional regulator [Gaiellales bacterium]